MGIEAIWVHGIKHDRNSAENIRAALETRAGLRTQAVFYKAILLDCAVPYHDIQPAITDLKHRLVENLNREAETVLILHSFGTYIAHQALDGLQETHGDAIRQLVSIRAYGGVVLLPNEYGQSVRNYLVHTDNAAPLSFHTFLKHNTWPHAIAAAYSLRYSPITWAYEDGTKTYQCEAWNCNAPDSELSLSDHLTSGCHGFEHAYFKHAANQGQWIRWGYNCRKITGTAVLTICTAWFVTATLWHNLTT